MKIFMTGGAGFLGRAIMRLTPEVFANVDFTVYSRDSGKHTRARREFPNAQFLLGDIRDAERLEAAMAGHDIVIHCGAMKYVPEGEVNVWEAVAVNVLGSRNVCTTALRNGIERVVGISTDKACRPVNVYGMTKLLMERLFQEADTISDTQFNLVRYGNVVSSTGSVVPLFRRQARDGLLTLTDPNMTRFWLKIEHAVELVIHALKEQEGGTILVPLLSSLNMADVATACAIMELGDAGEQIPHKTIGLRFGEKIHEELVSPVETNYAEAVKTIRCGDAPIVRMHPVTKGVLATHLTHPYTSWKPIETLTPRQMLDWIREAPPE